MPWVRATLRGKTVLARALATGGLDVREGRVEIRYDPNDGRLYRAGATNLIVVDSDLLADDFCGPAIGADAARSSGRGPPGGAAKAAASKGALAAAQAVRSNSTNDAPTGWIQAWTDGACTGNPGPAGLGIVLLEEDRQTEVSEYLGHATNNIAELTAILRALQMVPDDRPLLVRTDSQYSIGVLQKGWKAKANLELVAAIRDTMAKRRSTRLLYTPGHAGVEFNERADKLARMAVATRASSRSTQTARSNSSCAKPGSS
jgi:ribonuclease HI